MFSEVRGQLNSSKLTFSEKVNDTFGDAIIRDVYNPFEIDLQKLDFRWDEFQMKRMEIINLLMQLRTIL